jgi:GTP1/Obg family GTP-binding protein
VATQHDEIAAWFRGRVSGAWFDGQPAVESDNDEIWVVGPLRAPDLAPDATPRAKAAAAEARVRRFREETRDERVRIAHEAEHRFRRRVAWGVEIDGERTMFTVRSTPVMTRLHLPQRRVLDTLVDAGVARSRSDALAWCVRLVGRHEETWIKDLREALQNVEQVRDQGPQ